jgi:hypothetical protein
MSLFGHWLKHWRNWVKIWYDEFALKVGDSLSRPIDKGLAESRYGIVMVSPSFIKKKWPERELRGLTAREMQEDEKVILPIWLGVTTQQVLAFCPPLADTIGINTDGAKAADVAITLLKKIRPDIYSQSSRTELEKMIQGEALTELQEELEFVKDQLSEYRCSYCDAPISERAYLPSEPDLHDGGLLEAFECGHSGMCRRYAGSRSHVDWHSRYALPGRCNARYQTVFVKMGS